MKILPKIILAVLVIPLLSFDKDSLLNHPMPVLANKTLDGNTIGRDYYRGHVTLVTFMYIGCFPCMNEITTFNKLKNEYAGNNTVQILCVARQMREQMVLFNSVNSSVYYRVRKALAADSIQYSIQPACPDAESKITVNGKDTSLRSECDIIGEKYGVTAFPTAFFVDKKGLIRKIDVGGPATKNDAGFYDKLKKEIDLLLAE